MSNTLSELRKEKGFTQAEMAKKLGISVSAYCMYENGRSIPADIVDGIVEILKIKRHKNDIFLTSSFTIRKSLEVES